MSEILGVCVVESCGLLETDENSLNVSLVDEDNCAVIDIEADSSVESEVEISCEDVSDPLHLAFLRRVSDEEELRASVALPDALCGVGATDFVTVSEVAGEKETVLDTRAEGVLEKEIVSAVALTESERVRDNSCD